MAAGSRADAVEAAEKRGALILEGKGSREIGALAVLRRGALRIFEGAQPGGKRHRGPPDVTLQIAHRCEVRAEAGGRLRIHARVPYEAEVVLRANSDAEAQSWSQALSASIAAAHARFQSHLHFLAQGSTAYKYNYSNSKRMRRHFWVQEETAELCWGKTRKEEDAQTMSLKECVGIIYGPLTSTFQRCPALEDSPWGCFSLMFPDRTLDLAVSEDVIEPWFQGLQHLLLNKAPGCATVLSEAQFAFHRVRLKLTDLAHREGFTLRTLLSREVREIAKDPGKARRKAATNGVSSSAVAASAEAEAAAKAERRRRRREEKEAALSSLSPSPAVSPSPTSSSAAGTRPRSTASFMPPSREVSLQQVVGPSAAELEEEDLRRIVADLETKLEAATSRMEALGPVWQKKNGEPLPSKDIAELLHADGVSWQAEKCVELEDELLKLRIADCATQRQLQAAEKAEKQLRKLAKQFKEMEAQAQAMEQELGSAEAGALSSEQAKFSSSNSLERAEAETQHLERRKRELEQQLKAQADRGAELEVLQKQNREQAEKLARLQQEKAALAQRIGDLDKEGQAADERRRECEKQLAERKGASRKLVELLKGLQGSVAHLRAEQKQVRGQCEGQLRSIADSMLPLSGAVDKIGASRGNLQERFQEVAAERKKLHNLVLELKGNIRVFVRVRPMNEKEKASEPAGEPTISYSEETKVSVFEANTARRKWFEFDKAFQPKCLQSEVYEEVKPLATSVLDGYNVCIFAYGQTGSGKTFTMTGNKENPGLNTRVLTELFRIKEERRLETDIRISLMVTEIYNETLKDLFVTKQKKLDIKTNPDGTCVVPGLTERPCQTVEEVLKAMEEAASNRTVMATDMNEESSRSHSIVQVKTLNKSKKDGREYVGKINLIDLAGSENVNKSGVSGQGMKEAQNINKSLAALGGVIASLVAKNPHVPYRDSKLTMMLKDSLGGDSKTLMIVQCSPAQGNVVETLSSLNFASRARNVELGKAKRKVTNAAD